MLTEPASSSGGPGNRLAGRRILITGAASGIGAATARMFAREGAALSLLDVQADLLETVARDTGGTAIVVDLLDEAATVGAVHRAAEALDGLDGVVNVAGLADNRPLEDLTSATWHRVIGVNLTAPFLICREALPYLRQAPAATIVTVASGAGLLPQGPGVSAYAASKAGVIMLMKAYARELAPTIRANAIAPGIVDTPMVAEILGGYATLDEAPFVQQYALKRVARPDELASACLFLTSEESSFVTGTVLAVDGGRTFH
ncbi:MAG TPA: SDR family NAD(P)-dependent oxidoreductase [Novosphingobium sp.]|nr:SDR family NAD(P)-dependent oxidoreductase [Novosphingobium sp.]